MYGLNRSHYLWIFSVLIIIQSLWISYRIPALNKTRQPQQLLQDDQSRNVSNISQEQIEEELPFGGVLKIVPSEARYLNTFSLQVFAESEEFLKEADIKLFYNPKIIEVLNENIEIDKEAGLISYSKDFIQPQKGEIFLIELEFLPIKTGTVKLNFDFTKESRLESNLINLENTDVLEKTQGATIEIIN
jgi:hypothetical protein